MKISESLPYRNSEILWKVYVLYGEAIYGLGRQRLIKN